MLWRVLIAVLAFVLFNALLAPVSRIIGFPLDGDVLLVIRLCAAGLAGFYILKGSIG